MMLVWRKDLITALAAAALLPLGALAIYPDGHYKYVTEITSEEYFANHIQSEISAQTAYVGLPRRPEGDDESRRLRGTLSHGRLRGRIMAFHLPILI